MRKFQSYHFQRDADVELSNITGTEYIFKTNKMKQNRKSDIRILFNRQRNIHK